MRLEESFLSAQVGGQDLGILMDNLRDGTIDIERNLIIAVLRLTHDGPISHELVNKEVRIPSNSTQRFLNKWYDERLIYAQNGFIDVDSLGRLKLAMRAISLGADPERVSSLLQWKEFEDMAAVVLERNGYVTTRNLRLKHGGRKWEVDIVGCRKPLVLCADCKHWHHGIGTATLKIVVKEQVDRVRALAQCLRNSIVKIDCSSWSSAKIVPAIFSLTVTDVKLVDNVPVIPIIQLQDFLGQFPAYTDSLEHFSVMNHGINGLFSGKP